MQTPTPTSSNNKSAAALFSRERRRQRMLKFLETYERRSWPCAPELPYLLPYSKQDLQEIGAEAPSASGR